MAQGMVSSADARLVFRNAKRALKAQKVPLDRAILSQSYLRFETVLTQTDTNYPFSILVNQQNAGQQQFVTEQRLNLQDSFYISHMGVYLSVAETAAGNTLYQDYLMSFPSDMFNGAYNPFGMYNFYNGQLNLTINNRVLCPAWDLLKHLKVPTTQIPMGQLDQLDASQDGFYPVEPNWVLIGSKNNDLKIQLPKAMGNTIGSPNMKIHAIVIMRGVLAQNSTSVR